MTRPEHAQDGELAQRAAQGEERAWREIYDATCQPLFNFLCYQLGDRDAAKDALQETYLAAYRRLSSYRGDGPLLGWLRAIALRKSCDRKRELWRRLRLHSRLAREPQPVAAAPEPAVLASGEAAFQRALVRLSPQQRAALLLHELEEQSTAETAAALGCSEATVRVHLHRAHAALRRLLAEERTLPVADGMGGQQA